MKSFERAISGPIPGLKTVLRRSSLSLTGVVPEKTDRTLVKPISQRPRSKFQDFLKLHRFQYALEVRRTGQSTRDLGFLWR
jgi:hypothetical protein